MNFSGIRFHLQRYSQTAISPLLAAILTACGGGGDGGNAANSGNNLSENATPLPENGTSVVFPSSARNSTASSNFSGSGDLNTLSPSLIKAVLSSTDPSTSPGAGFLGENVQADRKSALGTVLSAPAIDIGGLAAMIIKKIGAMDQRPNVSVQATSTETLACARGGQMTVVYDDLDNSRSVNAGDRLEASFQRCTVPSGSVVSGGFRMRINAIVPASAFNTLAEWDLSLEFSNFGAANMTIYNGPARMWFKELQNASTRYFLRYENTSARIGGTSAVFNFDVDSNVPDDSKPSIVSVVGRISFHGGQYGVQSTVPLSYSSSAAYPSSGSLRLADASGHAIVILAKGSNVGRSYFPAGQSAASLTLPDIPWAQVN